MINPALDESRVLLYTQNQPAVKEGSDSNDLGSGQNLRLRQSLMEVAFLLRNPVQKKGKKQMNEVYISGFVVGNPVLKTERENVPHLLFYVDIQHKTVSGRIHHEMYTVNAWHNIALRASERLRNGQYVMLRGYLTQKPVRAGDMSYMLTELTVRDFVSSNQMHAKGDTHIAQGTVEETPPADVPDDAEPPEE